MNIKILIPIVISLVIIFYVIYAMGFVPIFTLDDAYIVQHSVNNITSFKDEVLFIDSSKNSGLTSLVHVSLVSLLSFLINVNWSQFIVASLSFVAFLLLVFSYSLKLNKNIFLSFLVTLIAATSGFIIEQTYNGLETILLICTVTGALYLFRNGYPNHRLSFILLAIMPFIRPELAVLSFILFVLSFLDAKENKKIDEFKKGFLVLTLSTLLIALYSIAMTGGVIPNTAGAKKYFFAEACQNSQIKNNFIFTGILDFLLSLGLMSIGLIGILFTRFKFIFLAFAIIFYAVYYMELPGGIHHNYFRYQYVFYAFAIVGIIEFLALLKNKKTILSITIIILISSLFSLNQNLNQFKNSISFTKNENFTVGEWVKNNVDKKDVVMIHDAGFISNISNNKLVDLVGLKTSTSVGINKVTRWKACGNDPRAIDAIASMNNAKYFIVLNVWDDIFQLTNSLRYMGWRVNRVDESRGETAYKVYKISK